MALTNFYIILIILDKKVSFLINTYKYIDYSRTKSFIFDKYIFQNFPCILRKFYQPFYKMAMKIKSLMIKIQITWPKNLFCLYQKKNVKN